MIFTGILVILTLLLSISIYFLARPVFYHRLPTECLLKNLYQSVDAKSVSCQERKRLDLQDDDFIYGEVMYSSFLNLLKHASPQPGEIFYDLGSGSGKAVFIAALCFDFRMAIGIEYLPTLQELANKQLIRAKHYLMKHQHKPFSKQVSARISTINFINDNFLDINFSDANIIFINATCLNYHHWDKLLIKLLALKEGSRVIVTSKKLNLAYFELLYASTEEMSWGQSQVHIYRKK